MLAGGSSIGRLGQKSSSGVQGLRPGKESGGEVPQKLAMFLELISVIRMDFGKRFSKFTIHNHIVMCRVGYPCVKKFSSDLRKSDKSPVRTFLVAIKTGL